MTDFLLFCVLFFIVIDSPAVAHFFAFLVDKVREYKFRRRNHVSK